MSDCSVSIIVPVYNVSRFLRRCLDSCVNQTLNGIEVIIVNDCSPDPMDTVIMREYEERYPDIVQTFWHVRNKKQGAARNTGISVARGKYLSFVDSDDYIDLTFCEKLYEAAEAIAADYVWCDYYEKINYEAKYMNRRMEFNPYGRNAQCFYYFPWGSLFRTSFIIKNNLFFPEDIFFEDNPMILSCMIFSNQLGSCNEALYVYDNNNGSSVSHTIKEDERIPDLLLAFQKMRQAMLPYFSSSQLEVYDLKSLIAMTDWTIYYKADKIYIKQLRDYFQYINLDEFIAKIDDRYLKILMEYFWLSPNKAMTTSDIVNFADDIKISMVKRSLLDIGCYKKRICVWGAGIRGKRLSKILKKLGCTFDVVDSDSSKWGKEICDGIAVVAWDEIRDISDVIIVSARGIYDDVKKRIGEKIAIKVIDMEDLYEN